MALDSKHKRGSVISLSLPARQWLAEPDGTLESTDRLSLLRYGGAIAADPGSPGETVSLLFSSVSVVPTLQATTEVVSP